MMPQRNQEKDSNSGVNLVWNLGVVDPGKQNRFLQANFRKISIFLGNFTKEYRVLQANFRNFLFFQAIKKIRFSKPKIVHWFFCFVALGSSVRIILCQCVKCTKCVNNKDWLIDWLMMSEEYSKLKEEAQHRETIGGLDLPEGRELKEEVIENSKK